MTSSPRPTRASEPAPQKGGNAPPLELAHLRVYAAWLAHGPCTCAQLCTKTELNLIEVVPRTAELHQIGALHLIAHAASPRAERGDEPRHSPQGDGGLYAPVDFAAHVAAPTAADHIQRVVNTLPLADQVSIAAGIMARHGKRAKQSRPGLNQADIPLTGDAAEITETPASPRGFHLE